jgi:hypothetical protein
MGLILKELIKRHGFGLVMTAVAAVALDGYRRTGANDHTNKKLAEIQAEADALKAKADTATQEAYNKNIADAAEKTKNCAVMGRFKNSADDHYLAAEAYANNPTEYRKNEVDRAKQKLDKSSEEVQELKSSLFEYFNSFYQNYVEYLDSLTPDKIVCVFNIIVGGLTLSSFFTIISVMLSENIINKIKFLDRFPRILAILRLRTYINKKIIKIYLFMHLVLIL